MAGEARRAVIGVKPPCPCCKSNAFVLPLPINVNNKTRIRFAFGNNKSIMPVGLDYKCVNPDCDMVQAASKSEDLQARRSKPHIATRGHRTSQILLHPISHISHPRSSLYR